MSKIKRSIWAAVFFLVTAIGCNKGNVNNFYKFPRSVGGAEAETKPVAVQVNVIYQNRNGGPALDLTSQNFVLKAYIFDGSEAQIEIGTEGVAPVLALPVVLTSPNISFDATVLVPTSLNPGPNGYAFHFKLESASESSTLQIADISIEKNLEALRPGVQPGAGASSNPVKMSIATSYAYELTRTLAKDDGSTSHSETYARLLTPIEAAQTSLENSAKSGNIPFNDFVFAMRTAIRYRLVTDTNFQNQIFEAAFPTPENAQANANTFSALVKQTLSDVKTALSLGSQSNAKVFDQNVIDASTLPDASELSSTIFAPRNLVFTDIDTSDKIGGILTFDPPLSAIGVDKYTLSFGGSTLGSVSATPFATIAANATHQFTIPSGTTIPANQQYFWILPVAADKSLSASGGSLLITNVGSLSIAYETPVVTFSLGKLKSTTPVVTDTLAMSSKTFSISPALPSGFTFNAANATISGTPRALFKEIPYQVTVTGPLGTATTTVKLTSSRAFFGGFDGTVYTTFEAFGKLFVGGGFRNIGESSGNILSFNSSSGMRSGGAPTPIVDGEIYAIVEDPSEPGAYYVSGEEVMTAFGADPLPLSYPGLNNVETRVFRVKPTGEIDNNFQLGLYGTVYSMAVSGDTLYVGGDLYSADYNNVDIVNLFAVNRSTGDRRTDFQIYADDDVYSLAVHNGTLFIGGSFSSLEEIDSAGVDTSISHSVDNLATVNATTGAPLFVYPVGADGYVRAMVLKGDRLYLGGEFTELGSHVETGRFPIGSAVTVSRFAAIKLNASFDGSLADAQRQTPYWFVPVDSPDNDVYALAVTDSAIYAGGSFSNVQPTTGGSPVARNNIAKFDIVSGVFVEAFNPDPDSDVLAIAAGGPSLIIAGKFSTLGTTARLYVASVNAATGVPNDSTDTDDYSYTAVSVGPSILVGGEFTLANTKPRKGLAAFDLATGAPISFQESEVPFDDGEVRTIATDGTSLYLAGQITRHNNGAERSGVVKVDPENGVLDPAFNMNISGNTTGHTVKTMIYRQGKLWLGGAFNNYLSGGSQCTNACVIDISNPSAPTVVTPTEFAVNGELEKLEATADSTKMLVVGNFGTIGTATRSRVAIYDFGTDSIDPFSVTADAPIQEAELVGNRVFIGGWFGNASSQPRNGFAAYDVAGNSLLPFDAGFQSGESVGYKGILSVGDTLYVTGNFTTALGSSRNGFAGFGLGNLGLTDWQPASHIESGGYFLKTQSNAFYFVDNVLYQLGDL
ncbi:MAG: hypothetical protein EOP04_02980 [Proteobacteria bacterium]|nr:MAG: hypothetical protein EOP04_02980 [Pseudomonadota bacterium]